jgi:antitoxin (DNA-binding transcriptional repressor) of toxin-antitoxin stability system
MVWSASSIARIDPGQRTDHPKQAVAYLVSDRERVRSAHGDTTASRRRASTALRRRISLTKDDLAAPRPARDRVREPKCETCYASTMKSISVRDLRQRWPAAEALLRREGELVVTRDGAPVAKLVRIAESGKRRRRFDPVAHARWRRKASGGKVERWVDAALASDREDRTL